MPGGESEVVDHSTHRSHPTANSAPSGTAELHIMLRPAHATQTVCNRTRAVPSSDLMEGELQSKC